MRLALWASPIWSLGSRVGPAERLLRLALAALLLTAAGLKMGSLVGGDLASGQAAVTGVLSLVEGLLAVGLVRGGVGAVWAGLILFGAFAGYSLRGVLAGRATCGCLGQVAVPPWGALAVDVAAVGLLAACGGSQWRARLGVGCLAAGSVWLLPPSLLPLEEDAGWVRPGREEPSEKELSFTVGQPVERDGITGLPAGINEGLWTVVFYREGCEECERVLQRFNSVIAVREGAASIGRLLLVRVQGLEHTPGSPLPWPLRFAAQQATTHRFITTPTVVTVRDGIVVGMDRGGYLSSLSSKGGQP
jgi:hypothetical protein